MTTHSVARLRSPYEWLEMYARYRSELCALLESFLAADIDRADLGRLYDALHKRQHDEIIGVVNATVAELRRTGPPE